LSGGKRDKDLVVLIEHSHLPFGLQDSFDRKIDSVDFDGFP